MTRSISRRRPRRPAEVFGLCGDTAGVGVYYCSSYLSSFFHSGYFALSRLIAAHAIGDELALHPPETSNPQGARRLPSPAPCPPGREAPACGLVTLRLGKIPSKFYRSRRAAFEPGFLRFRGSDATPLVQRRSSSTNTHQRHGRSPPTPRPRDQGGRHLSRPRARVHLRGDVARGGAVRPSVSQTTAGARCAGPQPPVDREPDGRETRTTESLQRVEIVAFSCASAVA